MRPRGVRALSPVMYSSHTLHFLAVAHSMAGRRADALSAAKRLEAHVAPHFKEMPMVEGFMPTSTLLLVRFGKWSEILKLPSPDPAMRTVYALWRFARGSAFVGQREVARAEREHAAFLEAGQRPPQDGGARAILAGAARAVRARAAALTG